MCGPTALTCSPENWAKETWLKVLSEAGALLNARCSSDTFIVFDLRVLLH